MRVEFDDRGRIKIAEERHARDQIPGAHEIAPAALGREAGGENAGPQPEYAEAADHHHAGDQYGRATSRGTASP